MVRMGPFGGHRRCSVSTDISEEKPEDSEYSAANCTGETDGAVHQGSAYCIQGQLEVTLGSEGPWTRSGEEVSGLGGIGA